MKNPVVAMLAMFLIIGENFNEIFAELAPEVVPVDTADEDDACDCTICRQAKAVAEAEDAQDIEDEDENLCVRCGCDTEFDEGDYLNGDFTCYECMTANEYRDI